jgi:ATP-dependent Clp protease adaptor protein ClpS
MVGMTTRPAPTRETRTVERTESETERLCHLVLIDDDQHTYEYVIEMLGSIFGYGAEKSFALARIVDTEGRAILETAERPRCERHQSQIHSYGADPKVPTCRGSMTAVIEEA